MCHSLSRLHFKNGTLESGCRRVVTVGVCSSLALKFSEEPEVLPVHLHCCVVTLSALTVTVIITTTPFCTWLQIYALGLLRPLPQFSYFVVTGWYLGSSSSDVPFVVEMLVHTEANVLKRLFLLINWIKM